MKILKSMFFYPLMFLRGPMFWILRVMGGFFFLGALAGLFFLFVGEEGKLGQAGFLVVFGFVMSFLCFLFAQLYDQMLLKLNPTDNVLILEQ